MIPFPSIPAVFTFLWLTVLLAFLFPPNLPPPSASEVEDQLEFPFTFPDPRPAPTADNPYPAMPEGAWAEWACGSEARA